MPITSTLTLTRETILRGKIVDPGWYRCVVKDVNEDLTKSGDSTNYLVDLTIISPKKFEGVPLRRLYNEKAMGFAIDYFKAFGVKNLDGSVERVNITPEMFNATVGREVDVMVVTGSYNNAPKNEVMDFRACSVATAATTSVGKLG